MKLKGKKIILISSILLLVLAVLLTITYIMSIAGKTSAEIWTLVASSEIVQMPVFVTITGMIFSLALVFISIFGIRNNGYVDAAKGIVARGRVGTVFSIIIFAVTVYFGAYDVLWVAVAIIQQCLIIGGKMNMQKKDDK